MNYLKIIVCCLLFVVSAQAMEEQENIKYIIPAENREYDNATRNVFVPTSLFLALAINAKEDASRDQTTLNELLQNISSADTFLNYLKNNNPDLKGVKLTKKEFFSGLIIHIKRAGSIREGELMAEHCILLEGNRTFITIGPDFWNPTCVDASDYPLCGHHWSDEQLKKIQKLTDKFLKIVNK